VLGVKALAVNLNLELVLSVGKDAIALGFLQG
jgi:hypothetical protein